MLNKRTNSDEVKFKYNHMIKQRWVFGHENGKCANIKV